MLAACPHRGTQRPQGGPSVGLSALASVSLVSRHPFLPAGGSRPPSHHSGPESLIPWLQPAHILVRDAMQAGRGESP